MSKGPPPAIKPKPKGLAPAVGKKPEIDLVAAARTPVMSSNNASTDDEFIASLRGGLRKTGDVSRSRSPPKKIVNQSVIDSVVSKPISLTFDPDALDSGDDEDNADEDEHETPRLSPAPPRNGTFGGATPFKSGVSASKSFPPPPQRNSNAIAATMASPLKKMYEDSTTDSSVSSPPVLPSRLEKTTSRETIDYAEGMRSPLKKNMSSSSYPPPPKRNVPKTSYRAERDVDDEDEDVSARPPSLPARKPARGGHDHGRERGHDRDHRHDDDSDEGPTPALPSRNRPGAASRDADDHDDGRYHSRKSSGRHDHDRDRERDHDHGPPHEGKRHTRREYDNEGAYSEEDGPGPRHRSGSTRKSSAGHRGHSRRDGSYSSSDEDEYGDGRGMRRERQSSTSLFLNNAKSFSKDSYYAAKEKSTPFAKQAMGGLNKMKDKLKSSMNKDDDDYDSEYSDDDRYRRRSERPDADDRSGRGERYGREDRSERGGRDHRDHHRGGRGGVDDEADVDDYDEGRPRRTERNGRPDRPDKLERPERPDRSERSDRSAKSIKSTRSATPEMPARPLPPRRTDSEEADNNYDVSVDEDRPSLPSRKPIAARTQAVGIPLPGLTAEPLKPVHKVKPPVPIKDKPLLPPKKATLSRNVTPDAAAFSPVPAPPARRLASNSSAASATPPPAPPSRNKAPAAPPSRSAAAWKEPRINLELSSLWFLSDDLSNLPRDLQGLDLQCSHGFVGTKEFKIFAFRLRDLATLKVKLVWKKGSPVPLDTLTEEVEFIPPPVATKSQLISGSEKYGEHIANWCEVKEGQTVGNGECWTLAHDALEKACGKHAFVSSGLTHGALIATFVGRDGTVPEVILPTVSDTIRRGDILQFKSCVFQYPRRTMTFGSPDHTAIVLDAKESDDADKDSRLKWLEIIHQNLAGVKKVRVSDIDLGRLASGELRVFRPVDAEWVSDLAEVVI